VKPLEAFQILFRHYRTIILYAAIGVSALGAELIVFYILAASTHAPIPISNALAMAIGFVISFTLNSLYNFGVKDKVLSRLVRFGLITFGGYWLSTLTIMLLITYAHTPSMVAKACSLPAFFVFQYALNKRFTFRQSAEPTPSAING
jgi:putative flippase GtrA